MNNKLKIIGYILIALVILAFLPIALPKLFGYRAYNVISGSMEPEISVGSIVYVATADFDDISEGDIIAFESGASVVTHRVTAIDTENKLFTTKGDANDSEDFMPVAYVNVIGKVALHIPVLGYIAAWVSEAIGKIIAVIILLIGVVFTSISEKKKEAEENLEVQKKNKTPNPKVILALGIIIIFGSLVGFTYIYMGYNKSDSLYAAVTDSYTTTEETTEWYDMVDVDMDALIEYNPDVIGWIYVEGTDISYPIMYSGDDETYLRTTIDKEYATAGSIFLEGYNLPDFSDSHNIIYGHNMRNLSMFGTLKYYKTEEGYLDEHQYFQIITADKKMRFQIFSYFDTEAASWVYAVPYSDSEEFASYIDSLINHSYESIDTENEITSADQIVTLSTCSTTGMRFTVHGVLSDTYNIQ